MIRPIIVTDGEQFAIANFRWRDRHANWYNPREMETRHVFYTLKMIWNHSAPDHLKLKPYNHYRFGKPYTTEYMRLAVRALMAELRTRTDLAPKWIEEFHFMIERSSQWNQQPALSN